MKGRHESQAAFGAAVSLETREIRGGRYAARGAGCSLPSTARLKPFMTHVSKAASLLTGWGGICVHPVSPLRETKKLGVGRATGRGGRGEACQFVRGRELMGVPKMKDALIKLPSNDLWRRVAHHIITLLSS